jgi:uracil-DNA glycosylase
VADDLETIRAEIAAHPTNAEFAAAGQRPLYSAAADAKIVVIGQAPGRQAQASGIPWDDASGVRLREWLGVTDEQFYDPGQIALVPMDFYYPGRGKGGDLPPRPDFAPRWHPRILAGLPRVRLTVLIGTYALRYYLGPAAKANLTETVRAHREYAPEIIPLVHPSPLNFRWQMKNPWFDEDVLPELRELVRVALAGAPAAS